MCVEGEHKTVLPTIKKYIVALTITMKPISLEARMTGTRVLSVKVKTRSVSMTCVTFSAIVLSYSGGGRPPRKRKHTRTVGHTISQCRDRGGGGSRVR